MYQWMVISQLLILALITLIGRTDSLPTESFDGAYQSYDAVDAVYTGKSLVHDSPPYLGLGVAAAIAAGTSLFGHTVGGSALCVQFLCSLGFILSWVLVLRLHGVRFEFSAMIAAGVTGVIHAGKLSFLWFLSHPDHSVLGIRSRLPFLTAIPLAYLLIRARDGVGVHGIQESPGLSSFDQSLVERFRCKEGKPAWHLALLMGLIAGPQVFWSNDYGIPSAIALLCMFLVAVRVSSWRSKLALVVLFGVASVASAATVLFVISGGHDLSDWAKFNLSGVARNQFWVFPPWVNATNLVPSRLYTLTDVLRVCLLPMERSGAGTLVQFALRFICPIYTLGLLLRLIQRPNIRDVVICYLGLATFGGALTSQIGGHTESRYFMPAAAFTVLVGTSKLVVAASAAMQRRGQRSPNTSLWKTGNAAFAVVALIGLNLGIATAAWTTRTPWRVTFQVTELGGRLPKEYLPEVQLARAVARAGAKKGLGKTQLLFSTYYSLVDATAGADPGTRRPAIIHALGRQEMQTYSEALGNFHGLITSLNPAENPWGTYNLYHSWPAYRELAAIFEPVARSKDHIFWVRQRDGIRRVDGRETTCEVHQDDQTHTRVQLPAFDLQDNQVYWVDVRLSYSVTFDARIRIPLIGKRVLILTDSRQTALGERPTGGFKNQPSFSVPFDQTTWSFPVEQRGNSTATVRLWLDRSEGITLAATACKASVVALSPLEDVNSIPRLESLDADRLAEQALATR